MDNLFGCSTVSERLNNRLQGDARLTDAQSPTLVHSQRYWVRFNDQVHGASLLFPIISEVTYSNASPRRLVGCDRSWS